MRKRPCALQSSARSAPCIRRHGARQINRKLLWFLFGGGALLSVAVCSFVADGQPLLAVPKPGMLCGFLLGLFLGGILLSRERLRARRAEAERATASQTVTIQQTLFTLNLAHLLQHFADAVLEAVPCRGVGVLLLTPQSWAIERVVVAGQIPAAEVEAFCRTLTTTRSVTTALQQGPLLLNAPQDMHREFPTLRPEMAQKNLLIVPLRQPQCVGLLILVDTQHQAQFSPHDVQLLTVVGAQAAVAIEQARTFSRVEATAVQRQALLRALMHAHEQERKRVAEEWHARFGEKLFRVLRDFRACHELIVQRVPEGRERFEELAGEVDAMAALVRSFTNELHPLVLDDFGFVAALQEYVAHLREQERFQVTVHADEVSSPLSHEANLGLFRILQEAVSNIRKHARAQKVEIAFVQEHSGVSLMIKDDGQGFNPDQLAQGYGLLYMRERAEACGGRLRVVSAQGQGTEVRVELPQQEKTVVQLTHRAHSP